MRLIDSHCHLDFGDFDRDREALLARCYRQGIDRFVVPGVTAETWPRLMALVGSLPGVYGALGMHPMFLEQHQNEHLILLRQLLGEWPAVAVGEIGLDFYHGKQDAVRQCELFEAQLEIAKQFQLPVILHVRKAHDQTLAILRRTEVCGGVVHAFSGSLQQAKQYQQLGFLLGVGGAITHSRATRLRRTLAELPLELLVLESDAPDMLPAGATEKRNTSLVLCPVASILAELHGCDIEQIAEVSSSNMETMFPLLNVAMTCSSMRFLRSIC